MLLFFPLPNQSIFHCHSKHELSKIFNAVARSKVLHVDIRLILTHTKSEIASLGSSKVAERATFVLK